MAVKYRWAAPIALALMVTAGCNDSDSKAAGPSTATFCKGVAAQDQGDDDAGPFTEFYEKHPEPTPADWAADGHLVTDALDKTLDDISGIRPSEEAKPYVDDVLAALETMKENSIEVSKAGKHGDQDALDELEKVNQDKNVPALMQAFQAIEKLCGAAGGS